MILFYIILYFIVNVSIIKPAIERFHAKDMSEEMIMTTFILGPVVLILFILTILHDKIRGKK